MTIPTPRAADSVLSAWLDRLAEGRPDPGGGAAAAVVLATACAVLQMTAGYAPLGPAREQAVAAAAAARASALAAADEDAAASAAFASALHAREDEPDRETRIMDASLAAAEASIAVVRIAAPLPEHLTALAGLIPSALLTDIDVAAHLAAAAVRSTLVTLRANTQSLSRSGGADPTVARLRAADVDGTGLVARLDALIGRTE